MREIDDDYPTLDIFDAIHRELVTIIGHCTFHRSVLQELILRSAANSAAPEQTLEQWRESSLAGMEQLRFSDLHKQDKELAAAVCDEAGRIAETFWNVLISRAEQRARVRPEQTTVATVASIPRKQEPLDGTIG